MTPIICAAGEISQPSVPSPLFIGQPIRPDKVGQWSEVDGVVTFVGKHGPGLDLELSSGAGHMQVTLAEGSQAIGRLLLNCRIRVQGICIGLPNASNGEIVSSLSVPGWQDITLLLAPEETWQQWQCRTVGEFLSATNSEGTVVHLRGQFAGSNHDGTFTLSGPTGRLSIRTHQKLPRAKGMTIEVLGILERRAANEWVVNSLYRAINDRGPESPLPVLTTTEQVRWLKPEEAERRYPVKVRAVVTFLLSSSGEVAGNLQDGTGGIYAWHLDVTDPAIAPGDYCEITGQTSAGKFSPGIDCQRVKILGRGQFPEPARPTWEELASGSLDAQWVELEGIGLSVTNQHLDVGIQGGRISCFVAAGGNLVRLRNAVIRIRGVVVADWDQARHVEGLHLNVPSDEFISLEEPPPADPFSLSKKHIQELLYYDPGHSAFRRQKVSGQIIGTRGGVYYLTDGTNGLRLQLEQAARLGAGSLVDAVGFPEMDDSTETPLITLREAVVRVIGQKPLPAPVNIAMADLLDSRHDATRVRVRARLVHLGIYGGAQVMELQAAGRSFFARLSLAEGTIPQLPSGSQVELTGVYVFNNGRGNGRADPGPFELLLNSPQDVRVLQWPSWWTARHAVMVVSGMGAVILLGLFWIALLRQQVGRRTAQLSDANRSLEAEIAERKRTENELVHTRLQHLVEQERTRIARDIHDELGSTLSQIRLLSELTLSQQKSPSPIQYNSAKISSKALEATRVLDEIVWAVDPQNDTLESLVSYLFSFASEFLSLAGIRFRIDAPTRITHHVLTAQVRHQLYMGIKETLTNTVNHAHATEVWIRLRFENGAACFLIEDNGRGFDLSSKSGDSPGASGLSNMRKRLGEIGGELAVESRSGQGTRIKFVLPMAGVSEA